MTTVSTTSFAERINFFDGQRLFASDLQFLEQFNREMRWLHNQSLHQIGIGSGFGVAGNKGDRQVLIDPGYAIDSFGREIVLTRPEVLQVPPVANDLNGNPVYYDLTVSYPDDAQLKRIETRDVICAERNAVHRDAVRLKEAPVFCWVKAVPASGALESKTPKTTKSPRQAKRIQDGELILLASAEIFNCQLNKALSLAARRSAKPPAQPFLFAGRVAPSDIVAWTAVATAFGITVSLKVSTAAGHFRTTPRYFAHVVGNRKVPVAIGGYATLLLDGFTRIENATASGFDISLLIPQTLVGSDIALKDLAEKIVEQKSLKGWYIEWMGIEG